VISTGVFIIVDPHSFMSGNHIGTG